MSALIIAEDIAIQRPAGNFLFKRLNFTLRQGRVLHIVGPNGVGKSTLIARLVNQRKPDLGQISYSYLIDQTGFLPQLHNMRFALPLNLLDVLNLETSRTVSEEQALNIGLLGKQSFNLMWNSASGGERQRTLITRLLLKNPEILILDEPFNHLDLLVKRSILDVLFNFLETKPNVGIIIVTHEKNLESHPISEKIDICQLSEVEDD